MFLRQLDLTTALRPALRDDETLNCVQDGVGLYEGKFKIPNYQNGHVYLTSHRICYVDNQEPRTYSVGIDLKDVDRVEFYAGFLKSSAKITVFPKANIRPSSTNGFTSHSSTPQPKATNTPNSSAASRSSRHSPAPSRDLSATWICPVCAMSNNMPPSFDPAIANEQTPMPVCQTCGVRAMLPILIKAYIAARSNRSTGAEQLQSTPQPGHDGHEGNAPALAPKPSKSGRKECPRCTFQNHPSLTACELCGAPLYASGNRVQQLTANEVPRAESPGPTRGSPIVEDPSIETIKLSFRAGGEKLFYERLRQTLVQRKWILQTAPSVPRALPARSSGDFTLISTDGHVHSSTPPNRIVGIAGLERRGAELRQNNQAVIGTAFEDLEALMTSAKEVIAMAEEFAKRTNSGSSIEDRNLLSASESALGLMTTKDMLGGGTAAENLYINELSRNLAEYLTDDRRSILRKEGGVMSLVDLWAVFNDARKGVELISPLDFEKAARTWDTLKLPVRLRRFKSGLLVVQERSRSDEKTMASIISWLRQPPPLTIAADTYVTGFGRGATAQEAAECFGWSVGVAVEELELAEELGALCRDQCLDGTRFWENPFRSVETPTSNPVAASMNALHI